MFEKKCFINLNHLLSFFNKSVACVYIYIFDNIFYYIFIFNIYIFHNRYIKIYKYFYNFKTRIEIEYISNKLSLFKSS